MMILTLSFKLSLCILSALWTVSSSRAVGTLQVLGHGVERLFVNPHVNEESNCKSQLLNYLKTKAQELPNGYNDYRDMHENKYNIPELIKAFKVHVDKAKKETYGFDGRLTHEVENRFLRLKDFWASAGVDTGNILCKGLHGNYLAPGTNNLEKTLEYLNPTWNSADVDSRANEIRGFIEKIPDKYNNPLLTFKSDVYKADKAWKSDVVLIGDGAIEFEKEYCHLGDRTVEFELAFAFSKLLVQRENLPELKRTQSDAQKHRRWELMEATFAAYFLAHQYGGELEGEESCILHHTAYSWGDCNEDSGEETGHGDPDQRECAAILGMNLATRRHLKGAVLDPKMIQVQLDNYYEDILAKDPKLCHHDKNHNMEPKVMPCTQGSCSA